MTEIVAVPLREMETETDLLLRLGLLLEPAVRRLNDLTPATRGLRHAFEVARRFAIVEVFPERIRERVERLVLVVELLFENTRDTTEEIRLLVNVLTRLETTEIELDEGLPSAGLIVELLELAVARRRPERAEAAPKSRRRESGSRGPL